MNEIVLHIEFLLRTTDCVVLPGFGAFIVQYTPAYYNESSQCFFPPAKNIVFNPDLKHNDGLLVSSVAKRKRISFDNALKEIERSVETMNLQLDSSHEISFGRLGSISKDYADKLIYHPLPDNAIFPEVFGIESLDIKEFEYHVSTDDVIYSNSKNYIKQFKKIAGIAASIVVLLFIGLISSTPIVYENNNMVLASLGTIPDTEEIVLNEPGSTISFPDIELLISEPQIESTTIQITENHIPEESLLNHIRFEETDPYALVVASFASESQAQEFISQNKGYSGKLEILNIENKFRVIAATGLSTKQVQNLASDENFKLFFPNSWPCRK